MRYRITILLALLVVGYLPCAAGRAEQGSRGTAPPIRITRRRKIIADFERPRDVARWVRSYISKRPFHVKNRQFASEGSGSMGFDLDAGRQYPGIKLTAPKGRYFNWSVADYLRFEVFNAQDYRVRLYLRIDGPDDNGRHRRSTGDFSLRPGINYLRFSLREFGDRPHAVDRAEIVQLLLFAVKPEKTLRFYLDQLRLEMKPEVKIGEKNVFLFDFGPTVSATMPGFVRISPQDKFSDDTGFGFSVKPLLASSKLYRLDTLADDYVYTGHKKEAEFSVSLPNGRYSVALLLRAFDDRDLLSRAWSVAANGKLKKQHGVSAVSFYSTKGYYRGFEIDYHPGTDIWEEFVRDHVPLCRFEAEVEDGLLRVAFKSCSLYAMMAWPAERNNWGERLLEQVRQMRKNEFSKLNCWLRPSRKVRGPKQAVLAPVSYLRNVGPDFIPQVHGGPAACYVNAAPGEYEPVALAFRAPAEYKNITVRVTDFNGDAGVIAASAADVRLARLFPKGSQGVYELVPTMLEPPAGRTLRADVTREFLVDVHVPDNAAPGSYSGRVILQAEGRASVAVKMIVRVRSFPLADDIPVRFAMFYGNPLAFKHHYLQFYEGYGQWEAAIDSEMRNMKAHGFNTLSTRGPEIKGMEDGILKLDFTSNDRLLKLCRKHGLAGRHIVIFAMRYAQRLERYGLKEFSPEFNEAYINACRQIVQWAKKNEVPILIWVVDEPRERNANWWNKDLAETLKYIELVKSVPGARTFLTVTSDMNDGLDYSVLAGKVDVIAAHPTKKSRKLLAKAGELCIYNAGRDRLSWGFCVWRAGALGRREWAYQWINQPYNPLDPENWAVAYPSPYGVLPTIDEKRIREGIDDYKYIYTLEKEMARARAEGRDVSAAAALLKQMREAVPRYLAAESAETRDLEYELNEWRERIAAAIEKLKQRRLRPPSER